MTKQKPKDAVDVILETLCHDKRPEHAPKALPVLANETHQVCSHCRKLKPLDQFDGHSKSENGKQPGCQSCQDQGNLKSKYRAKAVKAIEQIGMELSEESTLNAFSALVDFRAAAIAYNASYGTLLDYEQAKQQMGEMEAQQEADLFPPPKSATEPSITMTLSQFQSLQSQFENLLRRVSEASDLMCHEPMNNISNQFNPSNNTEQ